MSSAQRVAVWMLIPRRSATPSPATAASTQRSSSVTPPIREQIAKCDLRLAKYREALDEPDAELGPFIKWIAEVERERKALQAQLGRAVPGGKLDKTQLRALVEALRDIVGLLADADEQDRKELYQQLGVSLTYHPDGKVLIEALPRGVMVRVGGGTRPITPRAGASGWFVAA